MKAPRLQIDNQKGHLHWRKKYSPYEKVYVFAFRKHLGTLFLF